MPTSQILEYVLQEDDLASHDLDFHILLWHLPTPQNLVDCEQKWWVSVLGGQMPPVEKMSKSDCTWPGKVSMLWFSKCSCSGACQCPVEADTLWDLVAVPTQR